MWAEVSRKYEASSDGHIRNKQTGRVLKEFAGKGGYMRTQFDGKTRAVHRVIADVFIPKEPGKEFVNHKDGNKRNNSVENLEWCTRSENMKHAYAHGLKSSSGELNGRSKLTVENVRTIKAIYRKGDKDCGATALAKRYGVARQTICAVASGQNWAETLPYAELITGKETDT